jgi:hypothetical protein
MDAEFLHHPLVQSGAVPFLAAFVAAALMRGIFGVRLGGAFAGLAAVIGFLAAYGVIMGVPPAFPRSANQKLPYIAGAALLLGVVGEAIVPLRRVSGLLVFAAGAAAVLWLGERTLLASVTSAVFPLGLALAGGFVLWRLHRIGAESERRMDASAVMLVTAIAAAMLGLHGASNAVTQLGFALAAALGGFFLINWPTPNCDAGPALTLGAGVPLLSLVALLALFTDIHPLSLALLAVAVLAGEAAQRLPVPHGPFGIALSPLLAAAIAAVPAAAAVYLTAVTRSGGALWPRF